MEVLVACGMAGGTPRVGADRVGLELFLETPGGGF